MQVQVSLTGDHGAQAFKFAPLLFLFPTTSN